MDDHELLAAYATERSEEAFATLVQRHLDLVYSAALRQLHNPDQAQDVAQAVFLILARKAGSISRKTILSGWLYRTARYVALEAARAENRRQIRETTMAELSLPETSDSTEESWKRISPHLDQFMDQLSDRDRTAILLRFFQGKSFPEIAAAFSVSEAAAKKRVGRALERLRRRLAGRGIKNSTSVLGAALTAYAIQPAPAALAGLIPAMVCQGTVTAASAHILMEGTIQMIAWTKTKATDHGDEFPLTIEQLFGTGILQDSQEGRLRDSRYEYVRFAKAETKPGLPAVWWRAPDERGIRLLVFNDGSAQMIREPVGVQAPGLIPETANQY